MRLILLLSLFMPLMALAAEATPESTGSGLEPPDLPAQVESGRSLESTVHIREGRGGEVQEYRLNGRTYMVKIVPQVGPPYYLIDRDGDGNFETQTDDPRDQPVPMWVLFSW